MDRSDGLPSSQAERGALAAEDGVTFGHVVGLYVAGHAGAAVEVRPWVEVVPGLGIPGDRYATGLGHWSDPRWPDQELTLVEAEVAEALDIAAGELRRNVVTRGICLNDLIGATFHLGGAVLLGVRPCDPCLHLEVLTRPGLAKALASRGGLRAHILHGGRISVGDAIIGLEPATS